MNNTIIVSIISGLCVAIPNIIAILVSNKRNKELLEYRINELTKKVEKHNSLVERTYILEGQVVEIQHDIRDLKGRN